MKLVAFLTIVMFLVEPSFGQVPVRQRAVDLVLLRDGTRLLGAVVADKRGQNMQMLLRGSWLEQNAPDLLDRIVPDSAVEPAATKSVASLVQEFVKDLESQPDPDFERIGYLNERLIDLEVDPNPASVGTPDLVVISLPQKLIRNRLVQPSRGQNLAGIAVLNQIDQVEDLSKNDVIAKLKKIPLAKLLRQLPEQVSKNQASKQTSVQQEFQKLLVRTDRTLGKTIRLIYQSGQYVDEQNASAADLQALTTQMMAGQVQSQLQSLLNGEFSQPAGTQKKSSTSGLTKTLAPTAVEIAKRQQADVVEVVEMKLNVTAGSANVRLGLYHQWPDQQVWTLVAMVTGNATTRDVPADQKQRIAEDETVKQVTQLFSGLGSSGSNITNAISIGAAVEVAQNRARQALENALESDGSATLGGMTILRGVVAVPDAD